MKAKIIFCILLVLLIFCIESSLEYVSELIRHNFGAVSSGYRYGSSLEPSYFEIALNMFGAKLLLWSWIYVPAYFVYFSKKNWDLAHLNIIQNAFVNLLTFSFCVNIYFILSSEEIIAMLDFNKPLSFMSKGLHSGIIAVISPFIVYLTGFYKMKFAPKL